MEMITRQMEQSSQTGTTVDLVCDSVSTAGVRLSTFVLTFPYVMLAELLTHRVFSRNLSSTRAESLTRAAKRIAGDRYVPTWTADKRGMSGPFIADSTVLDELALLEQAQYERTDEFTKALAKLGVHKQDGGRFLLPHAHVRAVVTATEWSNFFALRTNDDNVYPPFVCLAKKIQTVMADNSPKELAPGEWHIPLLADDEGSLPLATRIKISNARCARASYYTTRFKSVGEEVALADMLLQDGHMSPFEHQAKVPELEDRDLGTVRYSLVRKYGAAVPAHEMFFNNFRGWVQYRAYVEGGLIVSL